MQQWDPKQQRHAEPPDIEQLLADYYGPVVRDQPLPATSWQQLRGKLGSQQTFRLKRQRRLPRLHMRRRRAAGTPTYIQTAFARIAFEAHTQYRPSMLHCTLKQHARQPRVSVSHISKRHIRLALPVSTAFAMSAAELDVLLATGLARYLLTRRGRYPLLRLAFLLPGLLGLVLLFMSVRFNFLIIGLPACMLACCGSALLLARQHYRMALVADERCVQWLGRGHVCEGLHSLASHTRRPERSHWDEPSLAERIARNCGTKIPLHDERLSLAR